MQLPEDFLTQTRPLFGDHLWQTFLSAMDDQPSASIRLNTIKADGMMPRSEILEGCVPWCESGCYLKVRPNFTFDPLLHAGLYYVQEASSMFVSRVLRQYLPETPIKMLDLCAAPGGKSTAARCMLPQGSLLVSNEPIRNRAQVLTENMMKQGCPDVIVTNNYAKDIARSGLVFDLILSDVPCSGEGMFRKDPTSVTEWSRKNVENCWRLQREIISDVWPALREGGLLVYSTCTFNVHENEENVRFIIENLGAEALPVDVENEWMVTGSLLSDFHEPVYRFIPGKTKGEGLFVAVLRKCGSSASEPVSRKSKKIANKKQCGMSGGLKPDVSSWICNASSYHEVLNGDSISMIPKSWFSDYEVARRGLNIMTAGVKIGEIKGKDVVPSESLALSVALNREAFPMIELDYTDALRYLRREQLTLPADMPRGYVLVAYRGFPLGFVKNIGNRANNLYPAEWRIRSGYMPDGVNEVLA